MRHVQTLDGKCNQGVQLGPTIARLEIEQEHYTRDYKHTTSHMSESFEVDNQYIRKGPQSNLFSGILLLMLTVRAKPRVFSIQL